MKKQAGYFILLLGLMLALLYGRFPMYFNWDNSKVISGWGDGYKTYVALVYHVKYDSSYTHSGAMNYPYGEHIVPGDGQPTLSNTLRWISHNLVDISDFSIPILHFFMFGSLLLCSVFLYLLFRELGLPSWYAVPVAIGISFLSPQIERMVGHFGLAHPSMLPATLYLLLRLETTWKISYSLCLAGVVLFFSCLHFYFFAILAFTISAYFLFSWLQDPKWRQLPKYALHYSIQLLLPLAFFVWWMYWNDPVTDRPGKPWGFFAYRAHWEGVFLSMKMPFFQWIDQQVVNIRKVDFESNAYVGLTAFATTLVWLGRSFYYRMQRMPYSFESEIRAKTWLRATFLSAIAILLFSFGLPFTIKGMSWLLDYLGPIQQFRSIGRFAWTFFYGINIATFAALYYWAVKGASIRWILPALAILLLGYEAWMFNKHIDLQPDYIEELVPGNSFAQAPGQAFFDTYQASIPIPYYSIGSDNFWWEMEGFIGQKVGSIAMQTGLPTTGAMLTRASLSQTINQLQLVLEPYRVPALLNDLPNQKPFLLAWDSLRVQKYPARYDHLIEDLQMVYRRGELTLYHLPLSTFAERITQRKRAVRQTMDSLQLYTHGDIRSTDSVQNFVRLTWDDQKTTKHYLGNGGLEIPAAKPTIIFDGTIPALQPGWYLFSIWMYYQQDLHPRTTYELIEYNLDGAIVQQLRYQARQTVSTFDNNGWGLLELGIEMRSPDNRLKIQFYNTDMRHGSLWLDEMLIRPVTTDLYQRNKQMLWYNNRWWENN